MIHTDRYLILENGKVFKGKALGADGEVIAETVFTTAMTGFLETLTDKSYTGQTVIQTFPLIGNYGVIPEDAESDKPGASAYVVREWCEKPSNFRCQFTLDEYLKSNGITGIYGIDTRTLTKIIRENGVMNSVITDNPDGVDLAKVKAYRVEKSVEQASAKTPYIVSGENPSYKVALLDFGVKSNIVRCLANRGCEVHVLPYNTSAEEILAMNPDGIFLSNGPGDPADNVAVIANIAKLIKTGIPIMGICLGHQLLALANGFSTQKLKYGHRGANQPVRCLESGRTYISSQNHGYAVVGESIDKRIASELFVNVNDGTNEGIRYKNIPVFSVQFHPEACGGPKDTEILFDQFTETMKEVRLCR